MSIPKCYAGGQPVIVIMDARDQTMQDSDQSTFSDLANEHISAHVCL